ncbi:phenylacetic acid degradation protein paaN [Ralstonia sp. 1138]
MPWPRSVGCRWPGSHGHRPYAYPWLRGYPDKLRLDNGPEFIALALAEWAESKDITLDFIEPGRPMQNGFIERFNGSYRRGVLKIYGENAQAEGEAAVNARIGTDYPLTLLGERGRVAPERSPYGVALGIRYPECDPAALVVAAEAAEPGWAATGPRGRIGCLLEALVRIHRRSHEIAHAVMLTTGQGPMMAFQAGDPHAQDRALEAIAYAWKAMADVPEQARWEKPQGKKPPMIMNKHFEIVGRGVALVIGCATFPTWNTYPGLFAALATGNPVIVKPHPNAVLPAALTVSICAMCSPNKDSTRMWSRWR